MLASEEGRGHTIPLRLGMVCHELFRVDQAASGLIGRARYFCPPHAVLHSALTGSCLIL